MNKVHSPSDYEIPKGQEVVLFDMDGTILDSEDIHNQALQIIIKSILNQEVTTNELYQRYCGQSDEQVFSSINFPPNCSTKGLIEKKSNLIKKLVNKLSQRDLEKILAPGIKQQLKILKKRGVKVGIVSASQKDVVNILIEKTGLKDSVELILGREDTSISKPSPSPYLKAMEILHTTPCKTTIFEDSKTGIASAKASGATVVQVLWADPN